VGFPPSDFQSLDLIQLLDWTASSKIFKLFKPVWTHSSFVSCKGVMIIYIYIYIFFFSLSPSWRVLLRTLAQMNDCLFVFFPRGRKVVNATAFFREKQDLMHPLCHELAVNNVQNNQNSTPNRVTFSSRTAVRCGEKTYFQPLLANRPHGSVQLNY